VNQCTTVKYLVSKIYGLKYILKCKIQIKHVRGILWFFIILIYFYAFISIVCSVTMSIYLNARSWIV